MTERFACPRCGVALQVGTGDAQGAAACTTCGGVWLGGGNDDAVGAALRARFPTPPRVAHDVDARGPVACPVCATTTTRFLVGDVEIDHCAAHGTWYDHGELARVRTHLVMQGHVDGAPPDDGLELARAPRAARPPPPPPPSTGSRALGSQIAFEVADRQRDRELVDALMWGRRSHHGRGPDALAFLGAALSLLDRR